jgi:hypothetical protein
MTKYCKINNSRIRPENVRDWLSLISSGEFPTSGLDMATPRFWKLAEDMDLSVFIDQCRETERAYRDLRVRLEAMQKGDHRTCAYCGLDFYARRGARYCSPSCRAQASRRRRQITE